MAAMIDLAKRTRGDLLDLPPPNASIEGGGVYVAGSLA
jgi:hypothetical protein